MVDGLKIGVVFVERGVRTGRPNRSAGSFSRVLQELSPHVNCVPTKERPLENIDPREAVSRLSANELDDEARDAENLRDEKASMNPERILSFLFHRSSL
jgi:hypothetical protein